MAIVREFTSRDGVHVIVRDDCYRDISEEEYRRRRDAVAEAILFVELRAAEARMRKEGNVRDIQGH